jgi:hypothetical protein
VVGDSAGASNNVAFKDSRVPAESCFVSEDETALSYNISSRTRLRGTYITSRL